MGNFFSQIRLAIREFSDLLASYQELSKRLQISPGLPVANPTLSFWTVPPSTVAKHVSNLPPHADIVIIGSGLTGTSFARAVLTHGSEHLQVVMLEARDACSGASGRNGGHINPPLYTEYKQLKEVYGGPMAKKIIKFRMDHFSELKAVSEEEGILHYTQCREVEHCDVYYDQELFTSAKEKYEIYKTDLPEEAAEYQLHESKEAIKRFHFSSDVAGCMSTRGGTINPYRLVTGVLSGLLSRHPKSFYLLTNTPCTSIDPPTPDVSMYTLTTPRGKITTPHIIHATNAYASHLLPTFRSKLVPLRGSMTAQRPGVSLGKSTLDGFRSFVFYRNKIGYDYLTQLPSGENELMVGGGFGSTSDATLYKELTNVDDSAYDANTITHLTGAVPVYFGEENWGAERTPTHFQPDNTSEMSKVVWNQGRAKAIWSGVLCISADLMPWVGRLSAKLSNRQCPSTLSTPVIVVSRSLEFKGDDASLLRQTLTSSPGEWLCASYSGEGMVHAWLCAKALAFMVLGKEDEGRLNEWFPEAMLVSETRWKKAKVENLLDAISAD